MKKENNSKKYNQLFFNNNVLKILSIILGITSWLIVVTVVDDTTEKKISNIPVEINLQDTAAQTYQLSVVDGLNQKVSVRVKGTRLRLGSLKPEDFYATAVVTPVNKVGEWTLNVNIAKRKQTDKDYDIIEVTPSTIKAKFDFIDDKTFKLAGIAENINPQNGYLKLQDSITVSPNTVDLIGPRDEINQIDRCVVVSEESITSKETVTVQGKLVMYDKNSNVLNLEHVDYKNQSFDITVPIYKQKSVGFKLNYVNVPQGIDVTKLKYTLSDSKINIAGPEKNIDNIDAISLTEIDFRKVDIGSIFELDVELASASVMNLDNLHKVTVKFDDDTLKSTSLDITNIITKNESALYDIKVKTDTIRSVKIIGSETDIAQISAADFVANINLVDPSLSSGDIHIPVSIHALNKKQVWAVGEYSVVVTAIKKEDNG